MSKVLDPFRFVLIALAGWMNHRQYQVIDYLREENRVLCGNPNVLQARQIRSITAATNPRMPVGLLNQEAITVERASALASESVRRRQYPFEFGGGSAVQSG